MQAQPTEFLPFTIMRNPNERLVSFWAYLKDLHNTPNATISAVLTGMLPNSMYRLLAPADSDLNDEATTMEAIQHSLRSSFSLVGLTERFEESLLLLKRQGIIDDISFRKHKVLASERPSFDDLPTNVQQEISQHNRLDQQLYDFAQELFEENLRQQDESFWVELEEFKAQQKNRFEQLGVCEDDEKPFGGWLCDSEARQNSFESPMKELKAVRSTEEQTVHTLEEFLTVAFKPRYW